MTNLTRRDFLLGSLGVASTFSIAGCNNDTNSQDSNTQESTEESQEQAEVTKYVIGDTVETDLVRLTLNNAALTIALNNSLRAGTGFSIDNDYFCPKEYDAEEDSNNPFVAPKGSTLVFYELLLENLDRDFLELDPVGKSDFVSVTYNGTTYTGNDFEEKEYGWIIKDVEGEQDWNSKPQDYIYLGVGVKELYRGYVEAPFEPESLTDPFEITFQLPKLGDTTESFTFVVGQ